MLGRCLCFLAAGGIKQLIDQIEQMFGGVVAAGDHAMDARREILFRQLAAITDDGVQRCPQLMADTGEEMCLGAVGRFGLIGRFPQARHQLGTIGR